MSEALTGLLRNAPLNDDKVAFAWRTAVGPAVGRGTTVRLVGAVLRVRAEGPWRTEITRAEPVIRARLNALLGAGVIRSIEVGGDPPP